VPVSNDEDNNKVETTWGKIPDIVVKSTLGRCHHHEVLAMIDGYDPKRGIFIFIYIAFYFDFESDIG
jgi:seryl-tRNA synthetase